MSSYVRNALRWRAIFLSRDFREIFRAPEGPLRKSAEHALADLRDFCFAEKSTFHSDALVMARREGRRDVWLRIAAHLNLNEQETSQLMEIDDGE
jgi:hypothetical protein